MRWAEGIIQELPGKLIHQVRWMIHRLLAGLHVRIQGDVQERYGKYGKTAGKPIQRGVMPQLAHELEI